MKTKEDATNGKQGDDDDKSEDSDEEDDDSDDEEESAPPSKSPKQGMSTPTQPDKGREAQ